jgi:hypothetical protein
MWSSVQGDRIHRDRHDKGCLQTGGKALKGAWIIHEFALFVRPSGPAILRQR